MHRFWSSILRPLADAVDPGVIVEIGVDAGALTRRILRWSARRSAITHAIDPAPRLDPDAWADRFGERLAIHLCTSLEALPAIGPADLALIDGDHNWYTVFHELRSLESAALNAGRAPPVVALHDVGWPYGARDMYYEPSSVPAEFRHAHSRFGMIPNRRGLMPEGGLNAHLHNAIVEGGARSGVLTAVRDFRSQARASWTLRLLPGFNGLGVLVPSERAADLRVARAVARLWSPAALIRHAQAVEAARVALQIATYDGRLREIAESA